MDVLDIKETGNIPEEKVETLYNVQLKMYRECIEMMGNNENTEES